MPEEEPGTEEETETETEEVPVETVEEEKPVTAEPLPIIFVVDSSKPTGSLTGPRALIVVDEKNSYPMNDDVNTWVRDHNIPIKKPTRKLDNQIKKLGITGQTRSPDLAALEKKLGE